MFSTLHSTLHIGHVYFSYTHYHIASFSNVCPHLFKYTAYVIGSIVLFKIILYLKLTNTQAAHLTFQVEYYLSIQNFVIVQIQSFKYLIVEAVVRQHFISF
jgi:hypothetical protein